MHRLLTLLALLSPALSCLIANFTYHPPAAGSLLSKPHLHGSLTSTVHAPFPAPICWLSKITLESPNDMYPLYCLDPDMTAYIYFKDMKPVVVTEGSKVETGRERVEVMGERQMVGFTDGKGKLHVDFGLEKNPGDENHLGAWNYECGPQDALW